MACRQCDECTRRFGTGIGQVKCIWCGGALSYNAGSQPNVTAEEYDVQLYVKGLKKLKDLDEETLTKIEREWEAISLEVGRRGSHIWSEADLIEELFRPTGLAT